MLVVIIAVVFFCASGVRRWRRGGHGGIFHGGSLVLKGVGNGEKKRRRVLDIKDKVEI